VSRRLWLLAASVACSHASAEPERAQTLPPSPVASAPVVAPPHEPTREEILAFCERYRTALEARDADALLALVSPRYDDHGTTYATLSSSMKRLLDDSEEVHYEIRYGEVKPQRDGTIAVDFEYDATFKLHGGVRQISTGAELVLERDGASFRILRGM
jgi:hypothetical protein